MRKLLFSLLLGGLGVLAGCGGSGSGSGGGNTTVTLVSIQVTPANPSIGLGKTQQFTATGSYSDGTTKNLTATANWLSSSTAVATINISGIATAVAPGSTTITATSAAVSGTTTLTVANALVSIAVTPGSASVAPNGTQQFTATGTFADGTMMDITSSVTWSASVGATITAGGLATAGSTPTPPTQPVTIMAAQGSVSGSATLTITNPLVSITVTGATTTIHVATTEQLTATGTYADGSTNVINSMVMWTSNNAPVATVSNSPGTQGLVTGIAAGPASITATFTQNGVKGTLTLTVSSSPLASIAVTPANAALVLLVPEQYTATGTFSDSTTQDISDVVTWKTDATKISFNGRYATGAVVTSTAVPITATEGSVSGNTTATVVAPTVESITITPSFATAPSLAMNTSRQYRATATLSNGSTLNVTNLATWSSSDPTTATVASGLVKALPPASSPMPVTITATYNGFPQTVVVSVTNATVNSITVTPATPSIPVGVQVLLDAVATFTDSTTEDITQSVTWTSSNPSVATITAGLALGVSSPAPPGNTTNISAALEGLTGTAILTVNNTTLTSIAVKPATALLAPASIVPFQAVGTYSDMSTYFLSTLATWTSSDSSVVKIVAGGVATGGKAGSATISATYPPYLVTPAGTASAIVTSSRLSSITVTPSPGQIPEGITLQFGAVGTFADGTTQNLTTNVTWASGQPTVATISNAPGLQGVAAGITQGQSSITAEFASIVSPAATLNVTNASLQSITVTPQTQTAPVGTAVNYHAVGTFSDGSTVDLTAQATWRSSPLTVATIAAGVANAASAGSANITAALTQNGTLVTSAPAVLIVP